MINYNPVAYTTPTIYLPNFTLTGGATLTQHMLVLPGGADKTFDGTTAATFTSLKGIPAGVTLVAGAGSTATFDTRDAGVNKTVAFTGYTLAGATAGNFALPVACCGPAVGDTTGNITADLAAAATQARPQLRIAGPGPLIDNTNACQGHLRLS
jgi:hypothetical protein